MSRPPLPARPLSGRPDNSRPCASNAGVAKDCAILGLEAEAPRPESLRRAVGTSPQEGSGLFPGCSARAAERRRRGGACVASVGRYRARSARQRFYAFGNQRASVFARRVAARTRTGRLWSLLEVCTEVCTTCSFVTFPARLTYVVKPKPSSHAAANGPARIRTWDQRIMSPLL